MREVRVRRGTYVDSITLMQVSRTIGTLDGVGRALVAMATDLNREMAADLGFDVPDGSPADLIVAVEAASPAVLVSALAEVDAALSAAAPGPGTPGGTAAGALPEPSTVRAAAAARPDATLALISTPGRHAFADAVDAVDAGLLTMVFSDNVPVEQEVTLKERADRAGVLVMGPDCGTAVVGGVGLGFANVVRPGPVGVVAASGTGAQQLMALLDGAGTGISHCLGVGGRDLSGPVAGRSTLRALDLLDEDGSTSVIVVVSKPPAPEVADRVRRRAESLGTPVLLALLGPGRPDLTEVAEAVVTAAGGAWTTPEHWPGAVPVGRPGGCLRGLFVGGTLCDEAMLVASAAVGPVASNIPLQPSWALDEDLAARGHTMLDLGDDRLTRGRPHPMIDGTPRVRRAYDELADPTTGVLLLDVVLGLGCAPDPAGELADLVQAASAAAVPVVVSLTGTRDDPQDLDAQVATLHAAGAWVFRSNAEAARCAVRLLPVDGTR